MIYLLYNDNCHHCYYHYYHIYVNMYIYIDILYTHTYFLDFCTYMPTTYREPRIKTPNHLHPFWQQTGIGGFVPVGTIITGSEVLSFSSTPYVLALKRSSLSIVIFYLDGLVRHWFTADSGAVISWLVGDVFCCLAMWQAIDYVFISIYLLEILLRVFAFGAANLRDGWLLIWTNPVIEATTGVEVEVNVWRRRGNCNSSQVSMDSPGDPQAKNVARHKRVRNCDVG